MKLFNKSTLALVLVSTAALSTANANQTVQPKVEQKAQAQTQLKLYVEPKLNLAELQRTYPTLNIAGLENAPELKGIKFSFNELLKASQFTVENYGKQSELPTFNFVQVSSSAEKKIQAKAVKLTGSEKQKFLNTVNQALMQAPVLAYYDYLVTGTAPTQKTIYDLVDYQNKRFGQVRLLDLPIALTGKKEDAMMNMLLNRISVPIDTNTLTGWYNQTTKMNTQPVTLKKSITYGALFTQARTAIAQNQQQAQNASTTKSNSATKQKS